MFWILITVSYLIILNQQIIATVAKETDNISTEVILTDKGHYQLNLTWDKFINPSAIKIDSLNETCNISCLIYPKDNTTSLLIPPEPTDNTKSIRANHECLFGKRCWYNITLETMQGDPFWNKTIYFSECVNGICLCENHSEFPKFMVWAKYISKDNITINWSVNISKMISNYTFPKPKVKEIKIWVFKQSVSELDLVGNPLLIKEHSFLLNASTYTEDVHKEGYWQLNSQSTFLPKHVFIIWAHIIDTNECHSEEQHFKLIVPELPKDAENNNMGLETALMLITFSIFGFISVFILIYKLLQKSNLNYWKNTYQSITPRPIVHIPMESNILYIEKDNILNNNNDDDYFEICPSRITISYELDSGAFGKVFKAFLKHGNGSTMTVAIKLLKKKTSFDLEEDFLSEIETMKNVGKHKHIIELLGCCTKEKPKMMIMEFVSGGSLLKYLQCIGRKQYNFSDNNNETDDEEDSFGYEGKYADIMLSGCSRDSGSSYITHPGRNSEVLRPSITETTYTNLSSNNNYTLNCEELHNFALQIAKGMDYLEEKGITHRDLAARNVLITKNKLLKISDFGLSRNGIYIKKTMGKIPWRWLSIEAIRENLYSSKSDIWAFGIVLWEIGTLGSCSPYPGVENSDLLSYLLSGKRLDKPAICSEELYNIMNNCWKEDLTKRPSFSDILELLKPKGQNLYVQLNSIGSNYVFPSIQKDI